MNKIKVLSVFGISPEAVKMASLVKSLEKDQRFESIFCITAQRREMLDSVVEIIFPIQKNPTIRELAHKHFDELIEKVHLIEPLEYVEFANLMSKVHLIMTDSGEIQEEAPSLGKQVIVLRRETEPPKAGTLKIARINKENIYSIANNLINDNMIYEKMSQAINPYWNGESCEKIINILFEAYKEGEWIWEN